MIPDCSAGNSFTVPLKKMGKQLKLIITDEHNLETVTADISYTNGTEVQNVTQN
jgi:hypothetical protein